MRSAARYIGQRRRERGRLRLSGSGRGTRPCRAGPAAASATIAAGIDAASSRGGHGSKTGRRVTTCRRVVTLLIVLLIPLKTAVTMGKAQTSAIPQGSPDHVSTTRITERPGLMPGEPLSVPGPVDSTVIDTEELRLDSRSAHDSSEERVSTGLSTPLSTRYQHDDCCHIPGPRGLVVPGDPGAEPCSGSGRSPSHFCRARAAGPSSQDSSTARARSSSTSSSEISLLLLPS